MGHIIEVSPKLSIELRRTSVALIPHTEGRLELDYDTVFALEAAVKEILASKSFQAWLKKKEGWR